MMLLPWGEETGVSLSQDFHKAAGIRTTNTYDLWIATDWFPKR